ncbi:MAG TPA: hypothetical protein VGR35_08365 [Tepidisphaeraceae bacterium]|nr:hypothetical protein [Tepidisphaeraceae bacterium]
MNSYQKTAVFFMRLIGFAIAFVGAMGALWSGLQSLRGINDLARGNMRLHGG